MSEFTIDGTTYELKGKKDYIPKSALDGLVKELEVEERKMEAMGRMNACTYSLGIAEGYRHCIKAIEKVKEGKGED